MYTIAERLIIILDEQVDQLLGNDNIWIEVDFLDDHYTRVAVGSYAVIAYHFDPEDLQ